MKTKYVVGLMFDADFKQVALIRKNKPAWQAGCLNGIGGKIEEGETAEEAMIREFKEETGYRTTAGWNHFLCMEGPDFEVEVFARFGPVHLLQTMEAEEVEIVPLNHLCVHKKVENLEWMILMAIDHLTDGRPSFARVTYSTSD